LTKLFYPAFLLVLALSSTVSPAYALTWITLGTDSYTTSLTLYAHKETTKIGGTTYYLLKNSSADKPRTTLTLKADKTGRYLYGKFVFQLTNISYIPESSWTVYYRGYHDSGVAIHYDVDILIRKSDGVIRSTIATDVAVSPDPGTSETTVSGTYSWNSYTVVSQTDYLEIDFYLHVTTAKAGKNAYLIIEHEGIAASLQTRVAGISIESPIDMKTLYFSNDGTYAYFKEELVYAPSASDFTYTVYLDKPAGGTYSEDYRLVYSSGTAELQKWNGMSWQKTADITVEVGTSPPSITFKVKLSDIANPDVLQNTNVWFVNYQGANSYTTILDRAPNSGCYSISAEVIPEHWWGSLLVGLPALAAAVYLLSARKFREKMRNHPLFRRLTENKKETT